MQGLQIKRNSSPGLVLMHYALGAIFFLLLCVLMLFSADAFSGHYFHPKLLALTHLAALGWGSMIIFGALYQLLPVILETPLYSERLGKITFVLFSSGVVCLVYSFWNFYVDIHLQIASVLILVSFLFFTVNVFFTARKAPKWNTEADFIGTSTLWLLLTGILGAMMAFNFTYPFLPKSHLLFLKIHAHMGIAGWFLLLIMGVGSKLIPMFLLSHNLNTRKLNYAYYLVNIGLAGFSADLFFREKEALFLLYVLLIVAGISFFISFLYEAYKKRIRKQLDIGLRHSFSAFVFIFIPMFIAIIISFNPPFLKDGFFRQVCLVYGVSIFFGFITSLILGQTFKTLPFIVWLHKYGHQGSQTTVLPKDLYSGRLVSGQYIIYLAAMLLLISGILTSRAIVITTGSILFLIAALLYNVNVFKILFHTVNTGNT